MSNEYSRGSSSSNAPNPEPYRRRSIEPDGYACSVASEKEVSNHYTSIHASMGDENDEQERWEDEIMEDEQQLLAVSKDFDHNRQRYGYNYDSDDDERKPKEEKEIEEEEKKNRKKKYDNSNNRNTIGLDNENEKGYLERKVLKLQYYLVKQTNEICKQRKAITSLQTRHKKDISKVKALQEREITMLKSHNKHILRLKASNAKLQSSHSNLLLSTKQDTTKLQNRIDDLLRNNKNNSSNNKSSNNNYNNNKTLPISDPEDELVHLLGVETEGKPTAYVPDHVQIANGNDTARSRDLELLSFENEDNDTEKGGLDKDQSGGNNDDDEHGKTYLPHDIFSFLMIARYQCDEYFLPALVGWFIFAFQMASFSLILVSTIDADGNVDNIFGIPANVNTSTRFAEVIAILIAAATEEDMRTAILLWYDGYITTVFTAPPGREVTLFNWTTSVISRCFLGLFDLLMTFLLIMRSEEVVDLLLNFSAIQFVASLDDVAFHLCKEGFMGGTLLEASEAVGQTYYRECKTRVVPASNSGTVLKASKAYFRVVRSDKCRMILFMLAVIPLIISWIVIFDQQLNGDYSCGKIVVQFGDEVRHDFGALSGLYRIQRWQLQMDYILSTDKTVAGRARFRYCSNEQAWVFGYSKDSNLTNITNLCQNWIVRSSRSSLYWNDLIAAGSSDWFIRNEHGKEIIMTHVRIFCSDCNNEFCGPHGSCSNSSKVDGCECDDGWYGGRCDFPTPCLSLQVDETFGPFVGYRPWSSRYDRLVSNNTNGNNTNANGSNTHLNNTNGNNTNSNNTNWNDTNGNNANGNNTNGRFIDYHNHPVYYSKSKESTDYDIIIYTGRRWIVSTSIFIGGGNTIDELIEYLENDFHPYWSKYTVAFVSEPVDIDTATDSATPIGLSWFQATAGSALEDVDFSLDVETKFLCAICDDEKNPCLSGGICGVDGDCDCSINGATGKLCQIPPIENGYCDLHFNVVEFDFDGGDCCEATCVSDEFECGQYKEYPGNRNYCDCQRKICTASKTSVDGMCWVQNSDPVVGDAESAASGKSVAMSADGTILAVGEPGIDSVRVFHKDGSQWNQLGGNVRGEQAGSLFGASVALSGNGNILVVGAPQYDTSAQEGEFSGQVNVYKFSGYTWQKIDETQVNQNIFLTSINASTDSPSAAFLVDTNYVDIAGSSFSNISSSSYSNISSSISNISQSSFTIFESPLASEPPNATGSNRSPENDVGRIGSTVAISQDGNLLFIGLDFDATGLSHYFRFEWNKQTKSYFQPNTFPLADANTIMNSSFGVYGWGQFFSVSSLGNIVLIDIINSVYFVGFGTIVLQYDGVQQKTGSVRYVVREETPWWLGFACCGVVSGNGQVVAAMSEGLYLFYDWESGNMRGRFNGTVEALSFDGSTVAMTTDDNTVQTYFWNGTNYTFQGDVELSTESGIVVVSGGKNGADTIMAIGMPLDASRGKGYGKTMVVKNMNLDENADECRSRNSVIRLELTTDNKPNETLWEIRDVFTKEILWSDGPFLENDTYTVFVDDALQLPTDVICVEFTIYDLGGDGICCGDGYGSYSLYYGGVLETIGGEFGWSQTYRFGNCQHDCAQGRSYFSLSITTDRYPEQTTWTLVNRYNGQTLLRGGPFEANLKTYTEGICFGDDDDDDSSFCVDFTIFDSGNDGICCADGSGNYVVSWDEQTIRKKGDFKASESIEIGECTSAADGPAGEEQLLFANLTINKHSFSGSHWVLYTVGSTETTSGNHTNRLRVDTQRCYLFEVLQDEKDHTNQISSGLYSVFLNDEEEIVSSDSLAIGYLYLIGGNCYNVTSTFYVPAGSSLECSNEYSNSCLAPAVCANHGITIDPVGENVVGSDLVDGLWRIDGAYSMAFGSSNCSVVCSGACNISPFPSPFLCKDNEKLLRLQLHFHTFPSSFSWRVFNNVNETLIGGGGTKIPMIVNEQVCIPDTNCTFFEIIGATNNGGFTDPAAAVATASYYLYVDGQFFVSDSTKFNVPLAMEHICPQLNSMSFKNRFPWKSSKMCTTAQNITVGENYLGETNFGFLFGSVEYAPRCGDTSGSISDVVWYMITGTGDTLAASLCNPYSDTQISVFSGRCDSLLCVAGNDDSDMCPNSEGSSMVAWDSSAGTVYYILINGYANNSVWYELRVEVVIPPANDDCTNATSLTLVDSLAFESGFTTFASIDNVSSTCVENSDGLSPGVWFLITGTGKELVADLCSDGGISPVTQVSLFSGDSCNFLVCISNQWCSVRWKSVVGTSYYILVQGYIGYVGSYHLVVKEPARNDICSNATVLSINNVVESSTFLATQDNITSIPCGDTSSSESPGLWFRIAGTGGNMEASLCDGSFYDTQISIYTGVCNDLVCVAGNDDSCGVQSASSWISTAGTDYYILVHGYWTNSGNFSLQVLG